MPDSESSDSDFIPEEDLKTSLDIIMTNWQFVEWKMGKRKVKSMQEKAARRVWRVLSIPQSDVNEVSESLECVSCNYWRKLTEALNEKCAVSSPNEPVNLLTLAPQSRSIQRLASEFSVQQIMVKKSRQLHAANRSWQLRLPPTQRTDRAILSPADRPACFSLDLAKPDQ